MPARHLCRVMKQSRMRLRSYSICASMFSHINRIVRNLSSSPFLEVAYARPHCVFEFPLMSGSSRGERAATYALVACAILLTGMVARREFGGHQHPTQAPPEPRRVQAWDEVQARGQVLGAPSGRVTLVEFSDFQCPYCSYFFHALDTLMAEFPEDLRVVYRHFPISSLHPEARPAAVASECAAAQGKFEAYYRALFREQGNLPLAPWPRLAGEVGLDVPAFEDCLRSGEADGRLAEDSAVVERLGLRGTPTVIVDGWELPGTPSVEVLRQHVEAAIERTRGRGDE